ncbi:uncharacterized protein EpC_32330 [Erwinia pyrifoliae Ep1/96]|nr:hypothetical protein CPI84_02240 [Erwinia pyrifoliae]MCA8874844.1 hypothetical protein [Erwinia pyrifoliae]CAX57012.1 uncharacterized protein EpC_32330 [Erwinia pyrifoliae Ep1/96]
MPEKGLNCFVYPTITNSVHIVYKTSCRTKIPHFRESLFDNSKLIELLGSYPLNLALNSHLDNFYMTGLKLIKFTVSY